MESKGSLAELVKERDQVGSVLPLPVVYDIINCYRTLLRYR